MSLLSRYGREGEHCVALSLACQPALRDADEPGPLLLALPCCRC
jgi:hypothetical protein